MKKYRQINGRWATDYSCTYKPEKYPPFFDVAEKLGIKINYKAMKYDYYGKYNKSSGYKYIKHYYEKDKTDNAILKNIMKILSDVEKIVNEVLKVSSDFEVLKKVA